MLAYIKELLLGEGIELVAPLSLRACRIQKPYLLERAGITDGTAFLFAVPYYTTKCDDPAKNISAYAVSRDYHRYFEALFARILPQLSARFPENRFAGFTDHSPIAEQEAAVLAGLGYFGLNHLFLTDRYSSFVFLGEIITDLVLETPIAPPTSCAKCGACKRACPVGLDVSRCYSALTQKKGALNEEEQALLRQSGCAWGCDICQEACPVTKRAKVAGSIYSNIPYFAEDAIPTPNSKILAEMSDEELATRAYGWRVRAVIARNLKILEEGEGTQ